MPPIKVARRPSFRSPDVGHRTERQAELVQAIDELRGAIGDMSELVARLTPNVLDQRTVVLDGNGQGTANFRVPFASFSVDYFGTGTLTAVSGPLAQSAPASGPGVAKVAPGGYAVVNAKAYAWSLYGQPGDVVTVGTYGVPTAPIGVQGGGSGVLVQAPTGGLPVVSSAFGQASVIGQGVQTTPGAGVTVAATPNLAAGLYEVLVYCGLTGTIAGTDGYNEQLLSGAASVINPLPVVGTASSPSSVSPIRVILRMPGGTALSVQTIAAGGASSVYHALIVATQIAN